MQSVCTGRLDGPQRSGKPLPPIATVEPGEAIVIEAPSPYKEPARKGPVYIEGVKPDDAVAIMMERITLFVTPRERRRDERGIAPR